MDVASRRPPIIPDPKDIASLSPFYSLSLQKPRTQLTRHSSSASGREAPFDLLLKKWIPPFHQGNQREKVDHHLYGFTTTPLSPATQETARCAALAMSIHVSSAGEPMGLGGHHHEVGDGVAYEIGIF